MPKLQSECELLEMALNWSEQCLSVCLNTWRQKESRIPTMGSARGIVLGGLHQTHSYIHSCSFWNILWMWMHYSTFEILAVKNVTLSGNTTLGEEGRLAHIKARRCWKKKGHCLDMTGNTKHCNREVDLTSSVIMTFTSQLGLAPIPCTFYNFLHGNRAAGPGAIDFHLSMLRYRNNLWAHS